MPATIEDRLAINDLFTRYATALDGGDVEGILSCFTSDATLESPVIGALSGTAAIRAFAQRFSQLPGKGVQLRHVLTNLACKVHGDTAHATCYLNNLISVNGEPRLAPPGRYDCDLVRAGDGWLFKRRLVVLDGPFQIPGL